MSRSISKRPAVAWCKLVALIVASASASICLEPCLGANAASISGQPEDKLTNQQHQQLKLTRDNDLLRRHFHSLLQPTDAPKFYHLNELLYKSSAGSESPQAAALPSLMMRPTGESSNKMGPLRPRGMSAADGDGAEDDSSIEGLVRMMRDRARPHETETIDDGHAGGARGPANGARLAPDDEASIQRKSTNLDDESAGLGERARGARIRSRVNIRGRIRRASIRQAPPKLKSRRVSGIARRKRLRHGIKPRRRA